MIEFDWDAIAEFFIFGFILGNKTMIKGRYLHQSPVPIIALRPSSSLDDVYQGLCKVIEAILRKEPNCAITVSGGQDSRILAGIVAELGFDIPALTYYSNFEAKIASRVCAKLGLQHYFAPIGYDINETFFKKVTQVIEELCGTSDFINITMNLSVQQILNKLDVRALIHGGRFNEVLGTGIYPGSLDIYFNSIANRSFLKRYKTRAYQSFLKHCSQMRFDEISLKTRVQSALIRQVKLSYKLPDIRLPILDADVLSSIYSLPYHERQPSILQRKMLKIYFPQLYTIPCVGMSPYIPQLPHHINKEMPKFISYLEHFQRRRGKDRPINTFSVEYFFERNRILFLKKLKTVSLPQNSLKPIARKAFRILETERIYHGDFLRKILTYVSLVDTLKEELTR